MSTNTTASVRLPLDVVGRRAAACLQVPFPGAGVSSLKELRSGASSLTYAACLSDAPVDRVVVKVAPAGHDPVRNRDVLRQARLLAVLGGIEGVLVPQVCGTDAGDPPASPPLFVMSHVEGDSFEPITGTDGPGPDPRDVGRRGRAAARMLARLHAIDYELSELETEPAVALSDEVGRWSRALETCELERHAPAVEKVESLLRSSIPQPLPPVITHGDFRLGNMLSVGGSIRAVIDWEIWSIGDPRVDLGWFLTMSDPRRPDASGATTGMPTLAQLVEEYEKERRVPVTRLAWFTGLSRFKEVAVLSLIMKHERRAGQPGGRQESFARRVPRLLALAIESLEGQEDGAW